MLLYLEDKRLVKQLLAGEQAAFDRFFTENFQRLYRFALVRLANETEPAQEVVHLSLSKALRKLHTYRGESALFTWLCVICRNDITDWLRRQGKYHQHIVLTEDHPEIAAAVDSFSVAQSETPETQFRRIELQRLIQVALDRLPPRYGDVLEWKYVEGYSIREIAQRLGLGPEATQSLLARAKRGFMDIYGSLSDSLRDDPVAGGESK